MEARIIDADTGIRISERDHAILQDNVIVYDKAKGPRVGDFIRFSDNVMHRFSHHWGDSIQTSKIDSGSFYFDRGWASFSGSLDPAIDINEIHETSETRLGRVWFFHHGFAHAHSAVYAVVPFRVYETDMPSDWWHRPEAPRLGSIDCSRTSECKPKRRSSRKSRK